MRRWVRKEEVMRRTRREDGKSEKEMEKERVEEAEKSRAEIGEEEMS